MENLIEIVQRKDNLIAAVQETLPSFVEAVVQTDAARILLHQDAFAADYQAMEYLLLGMAIKFAGIYGKELLIIGTNRQTVAESANALKG